MKIPPPPPGVYFNVPAATYHLWDAIGSTLLKNYAGLPSTANDPYVPSDDVNVGSGVHAYSLQGIVGLYAECAIMPPECEGTSKAAKDARVLFGARNPGKTPLPPVYGTKKLAMMDVLNGVDMSLKAHPKVGAVLTGSQKEVSLVWVDDPTGRTCKARLDVWDGRIIWDLKKARDIDRFRWQMIELEYYVQAGHYFNGAVACGLDPVAFGFIPCEAVEPFRVTCGYVDPEKLEAAQVNAQRLIGLVAQSQQTGNWPNFKIPDHVCSLDDIQADDLVQVW